MVHRLLNSPVNQEPSIPHWAGIIFPNPPAGGEQVAAAASSLSALSTCGREYGRSVPAASDAVFCLVLAPFIPFNFLLFSILFNSIYPTGKTLIVSP